MFDGSDVGPHVKTLGGTSCRTCCFAQNAANQLRHNHRNNKEKIDIILEGLPAEYESLVNLISMTSKYQPLSIDEIEAL